MLRAALRPLLLGAFCLTLTACPEDPDGPTPLATLNLTPTVSESPPVDPTATPTAGTETPGTATPGTETPTAASETPTATPGTGTPETPTASSDTPTAIPDTPTAIPDTPTAIPDTPTEPGPTPSAGTPTPTATEPNITPTPGTPTPLADEDGDGYNLFVDCDDANPNVNPGAQEICNRLDDDCDSLTDDADDDVQGQSTLYQDGDGDGYGDPGAPVTACQGGQGTVANSDDCDDADADLNPTTPWYQDSDGDGFGDGAAILQQCAAPEGYVAAPGDCDDSDDAFYPGAPGERCDDPNDYNCDGGTLYGDADGDGDPTCTDCADDDAAISADAAEICDGLDNDCDDLVDDADDDVQDLGSYYVDGDGDGYGSGALSACPAGDGGPPAGASDVAGDCDDSDADLNPETLWYLDFDDDGFGGGGRTLTQCAQPSGYVLSAGDCDDADDAYYPGAPEEDCADPNDYNCDGSTAFNDGDDDGFAACEDCNDSNGSINPDADEVCDGVDNDCDTLVDDADDDLSDPSTWYGDADDDGYGADGDTVLSCEAPLGYVATPGDCDDSDGDLNPDTVWYIDVDDDGFGSDDPRFNRTQCRAPAGYVSVAGDCNDSQEAINPDAVEVCEPAAGAPVDNDCDGAADESGAQGTATFYGDDDGDGFGELSDALIACRAPTGFAPQNGDCDDEDDVVYPGAAELCDTKDNDCNGEADNGLLGQDALCAATDCQDLLTQVPDAEDGIYWIRPVETPTAFEAWCEMDAAGGGWTLVASVVDRSYFARTTCTTACGDNPASAACLETPFVTAGTAGSVDALVIQDHKSLAYSTVPFREMLFQDAVDQWAAYDIAGEGDALGSVLDFYPAGLRNYVTANVEAHATYSYTPSATNMSAGLNPCNTLRMSFNVEDSDSAITGTCHSTRKGPGWSAINNNTCYWDDGGVAWTSGAFYQGSGTAYRFWLVR